MNCKKLLFLMTLAVLLLGGCGKDHYDLSNVSNAHVDGEMLLPLASASYSVMDLMERLSLDDMVSCDASGNIGINYVYELDDVLKGSEILRFHDDSFEEHYVVANPFPYSLPEPFDTVVKFDHSISLESSYLRVNSAVLKSCNIGFDFESNAVRINRVVVNSAQIKDANDENLKLVYVPGESNLFDLSGLNYSSDQTNVIKFTYEVFFTLQDVLGPELGFDIHAMITDLYLESMSGWVDSYTTRTAIDTVFSLFSNNVIGELEIRGAKMAADIRNSFGLPARLVIDTAMLWGEGLEPLQIFEEMPQSIDFEHTEMFEEVFCQDLNGILNAQGGRGLASTSFILNPNGLTNLVSVDDTCSMDVNVRGYIPFAFTTDDVRYFDTIDLRFTEIETPEWIEKLTIEMLFSSSIPLNIGGDLILYNSENNQVVDTIVSDPKLFQSTFDGNMCSTSLAVELDGDRINKVLDTDSLILCFKVDTDSHNAMFTTNQKMEVFLKARVKYKGNIEIVND